MGDKNIRAHLLTRQRNGRKTSDAHRAICRPSPALLLLLLLLRRNQDNASNHLRRFRVRCDSGASVQQLIPRLAVAAAVWARGRGAVAIARLREHWRMQIRVHPISRGARDENLAKKTAPKPPPLFVINQVDCVLPFFHFFAHR